MAQASTISTAAKLLISVSTACMFMLPMIIEFRSDGRQTSTGQLAGKTEANQSAPQSAEEQRVAQLEARIKEQEAQANAQRCQSLRNNLTNLNVGGRIYEMDANGKRQYLDGREIELKRERVQQAITQYCS